MEDILTYSGVGHALQRLEVMSLAEPSSIEAKRVGSQWQISVKDNGEGFENKYAERAFEPFKRLSESEVPGSGIGLATCKRIIERMGGRIWATSEPGKGSCFNFILPAEQAKAASSH
jgi:signal transduction histidine kinase